LGIFVVVFLALQRLLNSRLGHALQAIRDNESRMAALGFSVTRIKWVVFVIAGAIGGLSGALLANQNGYVSPSLMQWSQSGMLMIMVILGGVGRLYGGLVGAVVFLLLEEILVAYTIHWTLALGALMRSTGRLYAFDTSERRLANLKPRQARSGLSNVHPVWIDSENDSKVKRLAGKIDRVLVDAPCSGIGTLRRNPDLKWRQTPAAVAELNAKQASILASASRLLKPGGRLVYATCSLLPQENQAIALQLLEKQPEF
jgi:SAM-dependent methyltransferase